jgi:hypothetical protein
VAYDLARHTAKFLSSEALIYEPGKVRPGLPITLVASFRCRVLASTAAKLGVANDTGVCAVEEDVLHILVLQIGAIQNRLQVRLGEAWDELAESHLGVSGLLLTLRLDQDIRTVVETGCT